VNGLLRPTTKPCVWIGPPNCYRDQKEILWSPAAAYSARENEWRSRNYERETPSGRTVNAARMIDAAIERGGVTPHNMLPFGTEPSGSAGSVGHGAGTPSRLCSWWVRYISPPGGVVLDPFAGTSTVGMEAMKVGRTFIGIEKMPEYCEASRRRLAAASAQPSLFGAA